MPEINGLYEELKSLIEKYGVQTETPLPVPPPAPAPVPEPTPTPEPKPQITFKDGEYHGI